MTGSLPRRVCGLLVVVTLGLTTPAIAEAQRPGARPPTTTGTQPPAGTTPGVVTPELPPLTTSSIPPPLPPGVTTSDVWFFSEGVPCFGRIFYPPAYAETASLPAVVLASGWTGTARGVERHAARLAERGLVALAFDYRGWGRSAGFATLAEPVKTDDRLRIQQTVAKVRLKRHRLIPKAQVDDIKAAVAFLQGEPGVDRDRIGLWATDFAAGHIVKVASVDPRVKVGVAQVPIINGHDQPLTPVVHDPTTEADMVQRARTGRGATRETGDRDLPSVVVVPVAPLPVAPVDPLALPQVDSAAVGSPVGDPTTAAPPGALSPVATVAGDPATTAATPAGGTVTPAAGGTVTPAGVPETGTLAPAVEPVMEVDPTVPLVTIDTETDRLVAEYRPFHALGDVPETFPLLFIVAENDELIDNATNAYAAAEMLSGPTRVIEEPGITHVEINEGDAFERAVAAAAEWFLQYLAE